MTEVKILVVDPDHIACFDVSLFEQAGFHVAHSPTYGTANEYLRANQCDLIIAGSSGPAGKLSELRKVCPAAGTLLVVPQDLVDEALVQRKPVEKEWQKERLFLLSQGADRIFIETESGVHHDLLRVAKETIAENRERCEAVRLQTIQPLFAMTDQANFEGNVSSLSELIRRFASEIVGTEKIGLYSRQEGEEDYSAAVLEREEVNVFSLELVNHLGNLVENLVEPLQVSASEVADLNENKPVDPSKQYLVVPTQRGPDRFILIAENGGKYNGFSQVDLEVLTFLGRHVISSLERTGHYTDMEEYVKRVEDSQKALIQTEKMAAIGRLMTSVAHELNNPLQSVSNCLHLASRQDLPQEQRNSYLEMGKTELARLKEMVRSLLDYHRKGELVKESTNIVEIIEHVLNLLELQLEARQIHIVRQFRQPLPSIQVVSTQIQQVIFNLIINAIDALENIQGVRTIWIDVQVNENQLLISVEDSGEGIPEKVKPLIFEPFFSTKPKGTGLGLVNSYGIIEAHEGKLRLGKPKRGHGARFDIILPLTGNYA